MTRETAIKAIEAWRANPATTFTPTNILREFGDDILAGLRASAPEPTPDALEAANRRAEHYKHKKEIVATSRNRIAEGMEYWRERALLAESKMASPSTASTDKPAAIEYRGIALAAHNRATPVAPDASTPVQRPHE